MQFAIAFPPWVLVLLAIAIAAVAWGTYAGALVPLARRRRVALATLRALTLLLLVACLLRPVRVLPADDPTDDVVAVLVDTSRSMRIADADGRSRIDAASGLVETIRRAVAGRFTLELWTFGAALEQGRDDDLTADATRSDLSDSVRALRERYRERRVAAAIVISDGGDTGAEDAATSIGPGGLPVYAIGVGSLRASFDLEIVDVAVGDAALADSAVDLTVAASSRGSANPFDLRVLENGRPIDVRRVTPAADGSPIRAVFTVFPPRDAATVYSVEIPFASGELVTENNHRSVLVEPPGRARRLLVVEGAPGFEHTFLKRALTEDPGIDVDSVVRKGQDAAGNPTFFVQAHPERAARLSTGFPDDRATLFQYDAIVLANIDRDSLSAAQLEMASAFVADRGGGLLVLGAKSFAVDGIAGTRLDEALPAGLSDRTAGIVRTSVPSAAPFGVEVTVEGESHPAMRIGADADDTSKRWRAVPAMSGAAALGGLRPGAQVLALVRAPDGMRPLVAVQRYGRGRSMVFTGEASWRWRMQMPSDDRTYELFWRHTARWLSTASPEPLQMAPFGSVTPGTTDTIAIEVRDPSFAPIADASATATITGPGGEARELRLAQADATTGRYAGDFRFDEPGIYRIAVEARRGAASLGTAERWALAGGADREMTDPRLNQDVLRRLSAATGGQYLAADEIDRLASLLPSSDSRPPPPRVVDLWHSGWVFASVVVLLGAEWVIRRRWGLR